METSKRVKPPSSLTQGRASPESPFTFYISIDDVVSRELQCHVSCEVCLQVIQSEPIHDNESILMHGCPMIQEWYPPEAHWLDRERVLLSIARSIPLTLAF